MDLTTVPTHNELDALRHEKDQAYSERNQLLALVTKLIPAGDSYLARHPDDDLDWDDDWRWIVFINLPTGQGCWHIHDSELELFAHLECRDNNWDGHTTEEKYKRVRQLPPQG